MLGGWVRELTTRMGHLVAVLFLVSLGTFSLLELVPGDPAIAVLGSQASPERYEAVRASLGLDQPFIERYVDWIGGVLRGDLGNSLVPPGRAVSLLVLARLGVTLQLAGFAVLIALTVALVLGISSAYREGTAVDRVVRMLTSTAVSLPSFLSALLLIFIAVFHPVIAQAILGVAVAGLAAAMLSPWVRRLRARRTRRAAVAQRRGAVLRWAGVAVVVVGGAALVSNLPDFPRQGLVRWSESPLGNLRTIFLPSLAMAFPVVAIFTRVLRSDMITTLQQNYILMARAKGLPWWRIVLVDALKPASLSLLTVSGMTLGMLVGGSVIVETVFNLPGIGRLLVTSIVRSDFPVVQGLVLVIATVYVVMNTSVDLVHGWLDPRVRHG